MPSQEEVLKNVRAAFECEPRINLRRYPVHMTTGNSSSPRLWCLPIP
jgi:hypothetical protein